MKLPKDMVDAFERNGGLLKTRELVEFGRSKAWIGLCVREGLLSRIGHGVYALPDSLADDVAALLARSDKMILSHESAMYLNGLAEGAPETICVTVPSDRRLSPSALGLCRCHYVKPELHGLGAVMRQTTFGNEVRCYDAERTVCDVFRSRSRMDSETVLAALRNYVASNNRDLPKLSRYARVFGIFDRLRGELEVAL